MQHRVGWPRAARLSLGLALVATAVAACGSGATTETAGPTEAPAMATPVAPEPTALPAATTTEFTMTGTVWQWQSLTIRPTAETTTVPDPSKYTAVFETDGSLSGQADCNSYAGTWAQEGGGYTIQVTTSTMAACPEGSLDQTFLQSLPQMVAGGPDGLGGLALESAGGERRMVFLDGGPAAGQ